jgi:CDP-diacylglycerol--serine O-phosphatidyltransferase
VVKKNLLPFLAIPVHARLFGAAKTWRGVLCMPLFTAVGFHLVRPFAAADANLLSFTLDQYPPLALGTMLGLAYILAELPNSFIKRRMGIPPGQLPTRNRWVFMLADQLDSVIGCGLVYVVVAGMPLSTFVVLLFLGIYIAFAVKNILYHLGYKKTLT